MNFELLEQRNTKVALVCKSNKAGMCQGQKMKKIKSEKKQLKLRESFDYPRL